MEKGIRSCVEKGFEVEGRKKKGRLKKTWRKRVEEEDMN